MLFFITSCADVFADVVVRTDPNIMPGALTAVHASESNRVDTCRISRENLWDVGVEPESLPALAGQRPKDL